MMNDLAKERDSFHAQNDALRQEIHEANSEVETVRYSVYVPLSHRPCSSLIHSI
jgi:hypothetical protein